MPQGALVLLSEEPVKRASPKCSPEKLAYAARYREAHREKLRQYASAYYAANRERVLAEAREEARKRDVERLRRTPRCMICSTPLTVPQVRRGVTCGTACAVTRYSWFVRDRAA